MQIGLIGLGRMGMNMARRWLRSGHEVVVFNRSKEKMDEVAKEGALTSTSLQDFVKKLKTPRVVWLMLPTGAPLDEHINLLGGLLSANDIVIDGGNSYYKDDLRHAAQLKEKGVRYMDMGVSGGIWGLKLGYCTMAGGAKKDFDAIEPLLKDLAPKDGYLHCGDVGAGHFVKMVHNGIEYGMMQAYAEGFEILEASPYKLDLPRISHLWNQGSVIRSWLLELAEEAFKEDAHLASVPGYVEDSGEGRWTVQQAIESGVAAPAITAALYERFVSRQDNVFSHRVLAALRNKFGGHALAVGSTKESSAGAGGIAAASAQPGTKPR